MFLTICPICQRHFSLDDNVNSTICGHVFHLECIDKWFDQSSFCPVCHQTASKDNLIRLYMDNHKISDPSVGVDISNRDGVFLRFLVRPGDTVGSLVKELLDSHEVERIHDVLLHGNSLLRDTTYDSNSLLIRDCGLADGDSLHLLETPNIRLRVSCLQPRGTKQNFLFDFSVDDDVDKLRSLLADKLSRSSNSLSFLYTSGGLVNSGGRHRRFIRAFDEKSQQERLVSTERNSQDTVSSSQVQFYMRTILFDGSFLPDCPGQTVGVRAQLRVEYWRLNSLELSSPFIRLFEAPNLLRDPSICAWFSAHACLGPTGQQRFFLHCYGDVCVDGKSGEKFNNLRSLTKTYPDADFRYCVIMVKEGIPFPKFPIRSTNSLMLWTPAGLKIQLNHGSLKVVTGSERSEPDTWFAGRGLTDQLTRYFTGSIKIPKREEAKRESFYSERRENYDLLYS